MERKIRNMYRSDSALISVFIVFLWLVLAGVMPVVNGLVFNETLRLVSLGAGGIAGLAATSALRAVLAHLNKNRIELYTEDISNTRR